MIRIELPWPDSALLPNRRNGKHWASLHGAKTTARTTGYALALASIPKDWVKPEGRVPLKIFFYPPDKRRRDADGALSSLKHALDGISQAVGIDDSNFMPITIDFREPVKGGKVVVELGGME